MAQGHETPQGSEWYSRRANDSACLILLNHYTQMSKENVWLTEDFAETSESMDKQHPSKHRKERRSELKVIRRNTFVAASCRFSLNDASHVKWGEFSCCGFSLSSVHHSWREEYFTASSPAKSLNAPETLWFSLILQPQITNVFIDEYQTVILAHGKPIWWEYWVYSCWQIESHTVLTLSRVQVLSPRKTAMWNSNLITFPHKDQTLVKALWLYLDPSNS